MKNPHMAPRRLSAKWLDFGAPGGPSSRCCRIGYTLVPQEVQTSLLNDFFRQGYEVTEEEVQISFQQFKLKYSDPLGYPEYAKKP
jgi:hypothetical protein